jgi:hypothetical protein
MDSIVVYVLSSSKLYRYLTVIKAVSKLLPVEFFSLFDE